MAAIDEVWTTRSTLRAQALLQHHPRRHHVGLEQRLLRRPQVGRAGDVEDARDVLAAPAAPRAGRSGRRSSSATSSPASASRFEVARTVTRTSSPRATSARATCDPTNPVAPVTSVVGMGPEATSTTLTANGPGRRRHGHDALPAARPGHAARSAPGLALRHLRGRDRARGRHHRPRRLLRPAQRVERDAGHVTAVGRRLPRGLRAAARGRARHRLDPPERRHLRHRAAPPSRRATSSSSAASTPTGSSCSTPPPRAPGSGCWRWPRRASPGAGGSAAEAAEAAQACRRDLKVWFAVDTLEFLRRGGRVGGAQAWLGSTLKIKPILSIESEILPIERVRTSERTFERLIEYLTGAPRRRAATRSSSSTSTRPTRPSGWSSAGGRSTAASPRWSPRSAPSSAPTWGRGCSGSRGCGEACCTRAASCP